MTIYSLEKLISQFGTSLLFHVWFLTCMQISQEKWHELCPWHRAPKRKAGNTHPFIPVLSDCQRIQWQPQGLLWLGVKEPVVSRQAPGQSWTSPPEKPVWNLPTWHGVGQIRKPLPPPPFLPAPQPLLGERKGERVSETHYTLFLLSKQSRANTLASPGGGRGQYHIVLKTEVLNAGKRRGKWIKVTGKSAPSQEVTKECTRQLGGTATLINTSSGREKIMPFQDHTPTNCDSSIC